MIERREKIFERTVIVKLESRMCGNDCGQEANGAFVRLPIRHVGGIVGLGC
jgi:hypothetical protein